MSEREIETDGRRKHKKCLCVLKTWDFWDRERNGGYTTVDKYNEDKTKETEKSMDL